MKTEKQILGDQGEEIAANFLEKKGYRIIEKNWKFENLEIDLITMTEDLVVFVEVKTRKNEAFGFPEESVTPKKSANILEAAECYLEENRIENEIRFDIVSIIVQGNKTKIYHIEDGIQP